MCCHFQNSASHSFSNDKIPKCPAASLYFFIKTSTTKYSIFVTTLVGRNRGKHTHIQTSLGAVVCDEQHSERLDDGADERVKVVVPQLAQQTHLLHHVAGDVLRAKRL